MGWNAVSEVQCRCWKHFCIVVQHVCLYRSHDSLRPDGVENVEGREHETGCCRCAQSWNTSCFRPSDTKEYGTYARNSQCMHTLPCIPFQSSPEPSLHESIRCSSRDELSGCTNAVSKIRGSKVYSPDFILSSAVVVLYLSHGVPGCTVISLLGVRSAQ
jgi:hypothetical protein